MTARDEMADLVERAIAIIGPPAERRVVKLTVMQARSRVNRSKKEWVNSGYYGAVTGVQKRAARRVANDINRLRHGLRKPRGTSKREDVLDTILRLKRDPEQSTEEVSAFALTFEKAREFYGREAAPMIVTLSTRSGRVVWSQKRKVDETAEQVAKLLAGGQSQAAIAQELGLTKGRISQIVAANKRKIAELEVQNGYAFDSERFNSTKGMPLIRIRSLKVGRETETRFDGDYDKKYVVQAGESRRPPIHWRPPFLELVGGPQQRTYAHSAYRLGS